MIDSEIAALCLAESAGETTNVAELVVALRSGNFSALRERLAPLVDASTVEEFRAVTKDVAGSIAATDGECTLLLVAALCSQVYLQANWTGPDVACDVPFNPNMSADADSDLCKALRDDLTIDGEEVYERVRGCTYLWLAVEFLKYVGDLRTTPVWKGRAAFLWQRSLEDANDHGAGHSAALLKQSLEDLVDYDLSFLPDEAQAAVVLEIAQRMTWYQRNKRFEEFIRSVCDKLNFAFLLTGEEGIRRKYQTLKFAQLVVKAENLSPNTVAQGGGMAAPQNKALLEFDETTDILEAPKFDTDAEEVALGALQQCVLLAQCHQLWTTHSIHDEMMLIEINAMAQRTLVTKKQETDGMWTSNWLVFSCGLWFRCKTEYHRTKTRERATFQLQALVDQFNDEDTTGGHRMRYAYQTNYPPRHNLQWELGMRMMKMGMVLTAFEHFEKLKMWPEAVDCLIVAGRKQQALDLINSLLKEQETPRLWCCLGDLECNPEHYQKAWDSSGERSGRAQRALGHYYYKKGELSQAVEHYGRAVLLNPLHTSIWFNTGCAQMRLNRFSEAMVSFQRCCSIGGEDADAWGNLAACFVNCDRLLDASRAIEQAVKRARGNYRMWDSYLGIHLRLRDIPGCVRALNALIQCDHVKEIDADVVGLLVSECPRDDKALVGQLVKFCELLATKRSDALTWRYNADMAEKNEAWSDVWRCRLNELRLIQARIWDVEVSEFVRLLAALVDNLKALLALCDARREGDGLSGLLMSVRNCGKKLNIRMDQSGLSTNTEATRYQEEIREAQQLLERVIQERNMIEE
eukprot:GEMP01021984.1.p1 GENE.GEMP01021984.1~~GEMP01021984.1.p1  ORF type:complete len:814 (+),score=167.22 GEMP01021984.1:33-2444(+)